MRALDGRVLERGAWTCANCPTTNEAHRKRCADCGTSRH